MEEDIKILEQFLVGNKYCEDCEEKCVDCYIEYEEVQAVANLLTRYKQLEQENNNFKEASIINDRLYQEVCNKNKELEKKIEEINNGNRG